MSEPEKTDEIQRINGKFAPGFSGNPAGKPKGARHFTTLVRDALEMIAKDPTSGREERMEVLLAKKAVLSALAGDSQMLKLIWNYLDGMPKQSIELEDNRADETKEQLKKLIDRMNNGK